MPTENLLLAALPREVYEQLDEYMEQVSLPANKILHHPGDTIEQVYFPLNCLISVTITMKDGSTVEAGVIGNREMVGINAFMGGTETTQTEYIVQVAGDAVKMKAEPLRKEFDQNKLLRDVMLKYTQAFIAQISQNVACNRLHTIQKRLARWLLESSDRIQSDELDLSQEFISHMLGVRRSGVTETARHLQEKGPITYSRKKIKIVDRQGLEQVSCECYETLKDEYNRLLKFNLRENR
ncbi:MULTISPECIES: Crp/Fnr family transcriptional regulator [unclassified Nodularia (in: cyanobacteria)]|uniref:Crp/Fnr family transcriptional regulator n=1 Tax=unclassified Nodularia (in: cyanobacteria) TaxID=2656917 RepID=UPI00187FA6D3|nr:MULTISPECIES: Crp/Fnr family transcriptional regulator [unclassified Nodularia (in: cyanobacteria)]MBE9201234.1 Crp/Fnr family transcriptional regulator [Nodularia sp. LEGE 06071]MCC2695368.1 Crp/Fnr family transcriptional regulator [Nodularia sp. LEGE 04288]